jgi:predicted nucleic acid-binding protein
MILVDSDILIAHLRGVAAANEWLFAARQTTGPLATSVVSLAEVAGGMRPPERVEVTRFLSSLRTFGVGERIGWQTAELMRTYRRSHPDIGLGDYLIAATVQIEGLQLATLNVRHFPMFRGLKAPFAV